MQEEYEISLVDLMVIVIKHRRLIATTMLISTLVVAAVLYVLPLFKGVTFGAYTVKAAVTTSKMPPVLESELGIRTDDLAVEYAKDINKLSEAVVRHKLMDTNDGDQDGLNLRTAIDRTFIGQRYKVENTKGRITFELSVQNPTEGRAFLAEMIEYTEERVRTEISKRSSVIEASMESLYKDAAGTTTNLSDVTNQLIIASRLYTEGNIPAISILSEPEIFIDPQGKTKSLTISLFMALLLSFFLTFLMEYIERIKTDPESSKKIRDALGR